MKHLRGKWGWFLAYLYSGAMVTHVFSTYVGLEFYWKASLTTMISGTADRPFVTRALMPAVIRAIMAITPAPAQYGIRSVVSSRGFFPMFKPDDYSYGAFLFFVLSVGCFVGTAYALRAMARRYYGLSETVAGLAGLAGILLLPTMFRYFNYIYDPATILLASLMALCLALRQTRWFFYAFVVACVNKETAALMIPVFVVFYWREWPKVGLAAFAGLLVLVWAGIRAFINAKFAHNPGTDFEIHWQDHQMRLLSRYPMSTLYLLVFATAFVLLVRYRWRVKPWEIRAGLLITLLPLFAMAATVGYIDELRALYDAYPYMFLAALPGLIRLVGGREVGLEGLGHALSSRHEPSPTPELSPHPVALIEDP